VQTKINQSEDKEREKKEFQSINKMKLEIESRWRRQEMTRFKRF